MPFEPRPTRKVHTPEPLETKQKVPAQEPVDLLERLRKAEEQKNALHKAAKEGDEFIAQLLLATGADVNARAPDRKTALHFAVESGNEPVARVLLENKANPNAKTSSSGPPNIRKFEGGRTPLHWAAVQGYEDIISLLLDHGADIKAANTTNRGILQEALFKKHDGAARLLIERGAPINHPDNEGWQPIHEAANGGRLEMIKLLLVKGAVIDPLTKRHQPMGTPKLPSHHPLPPRRQRRPNPQHAIPPVPRRQHEPRARRRRSSHTHCMLARLGKHGAHPSRRGG